MIWIRFVAHLKKMLLAKARERAAKGLLLGKGILDNPHVLQDLRFQGVRVSEGLGV